MDDPPNKTIINPPDLAPPRGFNHGILAGPGRLLFLAGQTALDGAGRIVAPGDVVAQYEQVLQNVQAVVQAAGGELQNIVQITIYVRDLDGYRAQLPALGRVHRAYFGAYYPAAALFEVSRFFDDAALLEIVSIAVIP